MMTRTKKKTTKRKRKQVVGYLRVSTTDQDTEKNEAAVLRFANAKGLGKVEFVSETVSGMKSWKNRKLAQVVEGMHGGDVLIVPELSRLGRSLVDVLDVLNTLTKAEVAVYSVKENFQINGTSLQAKMMRTMLALFSEIEHDLISSRTREGLALARAGGKAIGRPRGPGKSRLDQYDEEIKALIQNGATKAFIAERYGVVAGTLTHWLKQHKLDKLKARP